MLLLAFLSNEIENITLLMALFFFFIHIPADALESLKQSYEYVCPNDGFIEQVML